jgi:DNA helicase-2/ATP-dependent DNA helicase PcrA
MTRAEKRLILTWAKLRRRFGGGEWERSVKSRFLKEVPQHLVVNLGADEDDSGSEVDLTAERWDVQRDARRNLYNGKSYNSVQNVQNFFRDRGNTSTLRPTSAPAPSWSRPPAAQPAPSDDRMPWDDVPTIQRDRPLPKPLAQQPAARPPATAPRPPATSPRPPAPQQGGLFGNLSETAPRAAASPVSPRPPAATPRPPAQAVRPPAPPVAPQRSFGRPPAFTPPAPTGKRANREGTVVEHPKYGKGTIVRREGDGDDAKLVVMFQRHGMKKLVEKFAGLK